VIRRKVLNMLKVLVPAVAALGLFAFALQSEGRPAEPSVGALETPVMGWSVHYEGALAKLAFGVAQSDQLALMMTCVPGDAAATVYGDVQPEGAGLMRAGLASQPVDPLSAGEAIESRIALGDPALRGLVRHGRLTVRGDAGLFQLAATREERRLVGDFLAYCSPGRV
jgi:hypothetical protein